MKLKLTNYHPKKNKGLECLNCGQPLLNNDNFCSYCGQKNNTKTLNFSNFLSNLFSGLFSYDSRFWTTFIPLLTKPGKVSKQYIEGKRVRFVNPFQLYLNVSIIFFLIFGFTNKSDTNFNLDKTNFNKQPLDSVITTINKEINKNTPKDSTTVKGVKNFEDALTILDSIKATNKATSLINLGTNTTKSKNDFGFKIQTFNNYYDKHPNLKTEDALDSLGFNKSFWNKFYYQQIININYNYKQLKSQGSSYFVNKITSYISIALFVFLPLFTLFLKLIFIRRNYTYMEHLVFVFHTQTVFFLLYIIFYLINYFAKTDLFTLIFILLFSIYLYKAMRNFYHQGRWKTFIKFTILNVFYLTLAVIGLAIVSVLSFMIK